MTGICRKNYILTLVSATLFYISAFMMNSVCGKYSIQLGADKFLAGITVCAFTLSSFFIRSLWGWISDTKSRKLILIAGGIICLVSTAILLIKQELWLLILSRLIFGCGYAAFTTAGGTIVCDITEKKLLPAAISFYGITNVLSQAVAPIAALWLMSENLQLFIITVTAVIALALIAAFFIVYKEADFTHTEKKFQFYEKNSLPASAVIFFFAVSTASVYSFVPVMAQERQIKGIYFFFILSAVALFTGRLINTLLCKKTGDVFVVGIGSFLFGAGFVLLALTQGTALFLISAVLYGLGSGFVHPVVNTAAVSDVAESDRGLATATFMMSQDLGMTAGAILWGFLSERSGFCAVYTSAAAICAVMYFVFRKILSKKLLNKEKHR